MSRPQKGKPDRDIMLTQAEALFAERGFGACSLRDVIGAMKCSTTAFYSRFGDKEQVFEELVRDLVAELHERAGSALSAVRNVGDGFEAGIAVLVDTLVPRKRLVAVALSEGAAIPEIRTILQESLTLLATLVEAQLHLIGDPNPSGRAWAVVGAIHMQVMRWAVFEDFGDEGLAQAVRDVLGAPQPVR